MKVFFVMVLVLVFGAVPNDGRTESEGTVFNKTQPYEGMNNVTVSSSKLVTYDYLYLVLQWPRSFCNFLSEADLQCYESVPDHFTVHGLWPQLSGQGIDCRPHRQYQRFNHYTLDRGHEHDLDIYWPDLKPCRNNKCFWANEYNKHGSCTFHDPNEYFGQTLKMVRKLRISDVKGGAIVPGERTPLEIGTAVSRFTHQWPCLKCIPVGNAFYLLEIGFSFQGFRPVDCHRVFNCGNGKIYFPPY